MTFYINTPLSRYMRRRMTERDWPEVEPEVVFPVDVKVEPDAFVLTALLPGVKSEDLNIQIVNETVSIQGEIKKDVDDGGSYLLQERPAGKFCRTLSLNELMDSTRAEAELKDGVLTLRIPKAEEAKPKMIKVVSK